MSRQTGRRWVLAAMIVPYALLTLFLTLQHEPWRDEADAWLVARDLPLGNVIEWTRSSGTPALWYALVLPLARSGLPYASHNLLHWVIAVAAALVFVWRAPFTNVTKALFIFSFYPAYQYAVIARTYALGILLMFAVAALYRARMTAVFPYAVTVALLCNTNAHSAVVAGALTASYVLELIVLRARDRRRWGGVAIMSAGMLLAFVQLYTPGYVVPPNVISAPWYGAFFETAGRGLLPWFEGAWIRLWATAFLGVVAVMLRRNVPALLIFAVSELGLGLIFTYLWIGGYRHYGLVLIVAVFALWIGWPPTESRLSRVAVVMLNVSLLLSLPLMVRFAHADITKAFSGSKEMAHFILQNELTRSDIAAHPPAHAEAVLAHLPKRTFWYAALGEAGSYMKWDRAYQRAMAAHSTTAAGAAVQYFGNRSWLFLTAQPLPDAEQYGLVLLYETRKPLVEPRDAAAQPNDERYWLYRSRSSSGER